MKRTIVISVITALLISVMYFFVAYIGKRMVPFSPSLTATSRNTMKQTYLILELLSLERKVSIQCLLATYNKCDNLEEAMGLLILDAFEVGNIKLPDFLVKSVIVDAWGRPVNVAWRNTMPAQADSALLSSTKSEIIIWSSGENGINEFGTKDDVYYQKPKIGL